MQELQYTHRRGLGNVRQRRIRRDALRTIELEAVVHAAEVHRSAGVRSGQRVWVPASGRESGGKHRGDLGLALRKCRNQTNGHDRVGQLYEGRKGRGRGGKEGRMNKRKGMRCDTEQQTIKL